MSKIYYSISEVSQLVDEESHVLRYWEKEFHQLHPKKNSAGNRSYTHKDIQFIIVIKTLLREKKYTLRIAKDKISNENIIDYDINKFNVEINPKNNLFEKSSEINKKTLEIFNFQPQEKEMLLNLLKRTLEHLKN